MTIKGFLKNRYFFLGAIVVLNCLICIGCNSSQTVATATVSSNSISANTPNVETPTILAVTNTPVATIKPTATFSPTSTRRLIPTETATSVPTIIPTSTRPGIQVADSTNYMAVGNKMWHPGNARMSEDLPIETSTYPWSPDGKQLVGLDSNGNISIFTLQTGELRTLENLTDVYSSVMWSPNGRYLSYLVATNIDDQLTWHLAVYDLEKQSEILITDPISSYNYVSIVGWSYDSMKLAYIRWEPSVAEVEAMTVLKIVDVGTGQEMDFSVTPPVSILGGSWSPVNHQIVAYGYDTQQLGRPEGSPAYAYNTIYLIDIDTDSVETLIQSINRDGEQSYYGNRPVNLFVANMPWSSDGKAVIYSDHGVICYLILGSREETCPLQLSEVVAQTGAVGGEYPSWSTTGDWIGFILRFDSLFCSPLAAVQTDNDELRYSDANAGDCAVFWGSWSPGTE